MFDFTTVCREFRGLVERRREVFMFLGTAFAALGLFLQNALQGGLPPSMAAISDHLFAFYAAVLMILSLILSLRMAKLHSGIVINGIFFAHLMQKQNFTGKPNIERSGRHNFFSVSFLQFVLVNLISAFSTTILLFSLHVMPTIALLSGAGIFLLWLLLYLYFHMTGKRYAIQRITGDESPTPTHEEWEDHISQCLQQSTQALLAEVAFAGLMVFSAFEALSGLGQIKAGKLEFAAEDVLLFGPIAFTIFMVTVCTFQLVIYIRTYVAIGKFCLSLDPNDRPYRPLQLSDSFLGYVTLAALFAVSFHMLVVVMIPTVNDDSSLHLMMDLIAFGVALLVYQITLIILAWLRHRRT